MANCRGDWQELSGESQDFGIGTNNGDAKMWSPMDGGGGGGDGEQPSSRGKHSATLLGGHVYVLGGRGGGGNVPLRDFWRYHLASGRWERLHARGDAPPALQEHSAVAHGACLYVFGGEAGTSSETPLWIFNTDTMVWRKLAGAGAGVAGAARRRRAGAGSAAGAAGPRGRRGHSAHSLQDCLLIYGGYMDLRGSTNELWAFHYETESWQAVRTATAGPARHRHAAALHGARLYVHGGQRDLHDQPDLYHYDTLSRVWTAVRTPAKLSPAARRGHAGLRAGAHFYIFGGEVQGQPTNELWRFHFATETWERVHQSLCWPAPRVDCCALLVPAPAPRPPARRAPASAPARHSLHAPTRPDPPASLFKEISKLSSFHIRRSNRCSYSMLSGEQDSTESIPREAPAAAASLPKSLSAYIIDRRQPADGVESPREADPAEGRAAGAEPLAREPISVPDFADMVLPTPVLSPVEAAKLVYLDSDEEEDMKKEYELTKKQNNRDSLIDSTPSPTPTPTQKPMVVAMPKSASVRFSKEVYGDDEGESSTSDYASAERVNRLSGASALGFCNPHYMGPDVRKLGVAMTPDSGVSPGDIELQELGLSARRAAAAGAGAGAAPHELHLLLVGGKEPRRPALPPRPLPLWAYRLL